MADDLADLQERIAYLERTVDDLSEMLAARGREVDVLTRRVEMLMQREAEREADLGDGIPLADQKPPHW